MKPRIFISSTIFDFRDLRSSLKYYLESLGYEVMLSEFNDFTKKIDDNSYQACLDSIKKSDYFILFIGSRVGGYYDELNKISITQKEYQTAYEMVSQNRMKIIAFVRNEIWIIKEDRKAIQQYIKNNIATKIEIKPDELDKIADYKSSIVNDAEFIFKFLDEVSRKNEMVEATKGKCPFPKNNWVHHFNTFSEIIDVINTEFNIKRSLFEEALIFNLKIELKEIVKQFLSKINGEIRKQNIWGASARRVISKSFDIPSSFTYNQFKWLTTYIAIGTSTSIYMQSYFIDKALESGIFLDYDKDTSTYKQTSRSENLALLKSNIQHLKKAEEMCSIYKTKFLEKYDYLKGSSEESIITINNIDILAYIATFDLQENVLNLSIALMQSLEGKNDFINSIKLKPNSPFETEQEIMKYEIPSEAEVELWIKDYKQYG